MTWETTVGVRLVDDEVVIAVDGDDARSWLNGQISNDLKKLKPGVGVYGLVLTSKGRILADVFAFERGGAIYFSAPREAWSALREHLEKYVIMEDVTLRETSLRLVSVVGPRAHELDLVGVLAGLEASVAEHTRLGASREVALDAARLDEGLARLEAAAHALGGARVDDASWERARITAGVPRFGRDFGERTYPQEAGLKRRALAFDKGCYHGQEVVCMLENRGQLSRSLVRLELEATSETGGSLRKGDDVVGELTSVSGPLGLGLVKRALSEVGTVLDTAAGPARIVGVVG